ncbi:L,D-transpeptidase [Patescibacteria group bacterium]|nr:L,D-transpeptidase [Patescibacteria group bacterium]
MSLFAIKVHTKLIILILVPLLILGTITLNFSLSVTEAIAVSREELAQFDVHVAQTRKLQWQREQLDLSYSQIDFHLPGISTAQADFFFRQYRAAVRQKDYVKAKKYLIQAKLSVSEILEHQNEIVPREIERLSGQIENNLVEAAEVLAETNDLSVLYEQVQGNEDTGLEQLKILREVMVELAERIKQRRIQMEGAVKSVIVSKGNRKLLMFEDEHLVYEMAVSLGRGGRSTRNGQFEILDKIEKVWGYYQIWMPYWMGIYFAGSSENGLHGIPWDSTGNRYWENDIGERDVTYGCVMAYDENMRKLFNWAEIGTPVTIID